LLLIRAGHPTDLGCMLAYLGLTLAGSKRREGMTSLAVDLAVCAKSSFLF